MGDKDMPRSMKVRFDEIKNHQGLHRYFFNTLWMFSDQVLRLVAGVLVGIWVARYLGPVQFGILNYAIAFVAIFGVVAKLGLDNLVVKGIVTDVGNTDYYLGTAFWLKIIGSLITLTITGAYLFISNEPGATPIYILILSTGMIFQSFEVIDFYFQAKVLSKFASISKTVQLIVSCIVKIYLIYIEADLVLFVAVQFLDQVSLGLTQFVVFKVYTKSTKFLTHFNLDIAKDLLKHSWPLIFGSIAIMIYMRIDQIMIMKMVGEREMGLFSAAVRLSEAWYFVPMVITNSLFPAILNAKKVDEGEYYRRLQRLLILMVIISLAVAIPATFLSKWVMTILFGEAYAAGASVLSIHIWAGLFTSLGLASSGWFLSENLLRFSLVKTVIGVFINIILNFILIPKFGIAGAAISTIVCQAAVSFLFNSLHPKSFIVFKMQLKALVFLK